MEVQDNKYYTPDITEFHVGFECEINHRDRDGSGNRTWSKEIIRFSQPYMDFIKYLFEKEKNNIRVKYLDKEDIESLGFKEYVHSYGTDFRNKTHKIAWWWDNKGIEIRIITESGIGEKCVFSGVVKNKSELKKLLEQLNIKNDK